MNSGAANSSFCKRVSFAVRVLFIVLCSEELVVVSSDILVSADDRRVSFAVKVLFIVSCSEELVVVSSVIDCLMAAISEFVAELLLSFEVVRLSILSLMAACSEELVDVSSDKSDCMVVRSVFNSSTYSEM